MKALTLAQAAYVAGIVDGEGYIGLGKAQKNNSFVPRVDVTNTYLDLLTWLKQTTGLGSIFENDNGSRNKKRCFVWSLKETNKHPF